jgi:hypothetical protein
VHLNDCSRDDVARVYVLLPKEKEESNRQACCDALVVAPLIHVPGTRH